MIEFNAKLNTNWEKQIIVTCNLGTSIKSHCKFLSSLILIYTMKLQLNSLVLDG